MRRKRKREPDECIVCTYACPWDDMLAVPGRGVVHSACAAQLSPEDAHAMSAGDQRRAFLKAARGLPRLRGMTPRRRRR